MSIAIVGAGAAGLAAAHTLACAGHAVACLEKSCGLGGRAATRWHDDARGRRWRFDHGAQYFSADPGSPEGRLIAETLGSDGLVSVARPVWPFGNDGTLHPEDARDDGRPKWTYEAGAADLGRRLADASPGLVVHRQARVHALAWEDEHWFLRLGAGRPAGMPGRLGPFEALVLTPPAPQTADLLAASAGFDAAPLVRALGAARYRRQFALALGFERVLERPGGSDGPYALVNAPPGGEPPAHSVAWVAFESDKPGRAPSGTTLLLAQMSDAWTAAHYDAPPDALVAAARMALADVLGPLPEHAWANTQRWRYALPDTAADADALRRHAPPGLFFAGDALAGRGRVAAALASGLAAAEHLLQHVSTLPHGS
ncbi:MAG: NAD(P)/FAD-dependent oxidoreductase [Rubricoccaceae bacterium]